MASARRFVRSMVFLVTTGFRSCPGWVVFTAALQLLGGFSFAFFPYGLRLLTDGIVAHDKGELVVAAVLAGGLFIVAWITGFLGTTASFQVAGRSDLYITTRIAELVNDNPGLEHFERPDYLRELDLLNQNRLLLSGAPQQLLNMLVLAVRMGLILFLLATVDRLFLLLPIAALAPIIGDTLSVRYRQRCDDELAEPTRLANELFAIAATAGPAKELRVFGLKGEISRRHHELSSEVVSKTSRAGLLAAILGGAGWLIFGASFVAIISQVIVGVVHGNTTSGQLVMVFVFAANIQLQLGQVTSGAGTLVRARKIAERFLWLEDYTASVTSFRGVGRVPDRIKSGITLKDVTFTYPGTNNPVLRDVSLQLPAGTAVAVVGENGAGKTTLAKLLTRMYEPTSGDIFLDDIALAHFDVDEWRANVATTFQDFVRYEFRAGTTVGVGDLPNMDNDDAVALALTRAGASDVVPKLADGLDTPLGRSFPDGRDLSGGEWQKMALGRGRMRADPLLLILDEPTASLDAPTEHALFKRYVDAARDAARRRGTVTVLVSHRFSTVRMADLIIVLDQGRATEIGTHEQLITSGGIYAELFALQQRPYL